jgi:putative ABC transport system permease protein
MASAMRRVSLRNLGAHKVRLALTVISVVLGTAFVGGSFVFTDTLKGTFDSIFANSLKGIDVEVKPVNARNVGVPISLVDKIKAVDGVRAVQQQISGSALLIDKFGKAVHGGGAPSVGGIWTPANESIETPPNIVSGSAPQQDGQVAINESAAKKAHLVVGDRTKVVVPTSGTVDVTISGIYHLKSATGGYIGILFPADQGVKLFTDGQHVPAVDIAGQSGVSEKTLQQRVAAVIPADLQAKTGDQVRASAESAVQTALSFVNYFLLAFGLIALLVGTFIIYNTFSMIVAQRLRELALLRAIGASRRQVSRSVLFEAAIIGLLGSLLGLAGGIGLAYGLSAVLDATGSGLPGGGLVLSSRTVIVSLVVGIGVTMISAYAPARRASKIPPVAAMRAEFASTGSSLRRRTMIGTIVLAVGVLAAIGGAVSTSASAGASLVGLGLLFCGAGALMLSPQLAQWVIGALSVIVRPFGAVGRLARTNAVRNPRRTAATAFALTVGLLLVSAIGVVGASTKSNINALIDTSVKADFIITGTGNSQLPPVASEAASKVSGVGSYVSVYDVAATIGDTNVSGSAVDGDLSTMFSMKVVQGSSAISGSNLVVSKGYLESHDWKLGQQKALLQPGGASRTVTITGVYSDNQLFSSWIVSDDTFRALTPANKVRQDVGLVKAAPGTNLRSLQTSLQNAVDPFYVAQVQTRDQFKGQQADQINSLLSVLYGLLGLAIVISILGIINTLALSVVERRREIGMLRAIGAQRKQVRRTIQLESLLIALFGALLGLVLGISFGALFTHTLRSQGLTVISIPWTQDIVFLVIAGIVGVIAALWPAVRAARTKPLEAIADA